MQIIEAHQELSYNYADVFFSYVTWFQQIRTATPRAELHYYPEIRSFEEGPMVLRYVGRM